MNRQFFLGFAAACGLGLMLGLTPINNRFDDESYVYRELSNLYQHVQDRQLTLMTSTPTYSMLREREQVVVSVPGAVSIFTRVGNSTYSMTLSR